MLANSSNNKSHLHNTGIFVGLLLWVIAGFIVAYLLLGGGLWVLETAGVRLDSMNGVVLNTILAAVVYVLSLAIVVGVPWLIKKRATTKEDVGLTRLPSWMDILLAPAGFIVYFILSSVIVLGATRLIPGFNTDQTQTTGFEGINQQYEYILAFVTLVVVAPVAEEILFRGYLYGKLKKHAPVWVAALGTSLLFGAIHGQWNVGVDVFALSLVLCSLREVTGNIWAGMLLHMLKNGVAFYFLFVNTALLDTIMK
ncbi:MAG TPA: type II CAAX endopeptidase family protein [Candidatus Saccharimonadales bacterium]|nr:type II CAAX endopeptidase family protein [Candidatus Saccharimonadales bacterium]